MNRYDYQENPQVQYWKEKCEALENELALERACSGSFADDLRVLNLELQQNDGLIQEEVKQNSSLRKQLEEHRTEMLFFNSLPWYEKIFYKFDLD